MREYKNGKIDRSRQRFSFILWRVNWDRLANNIWKCQCDLIDYFRRYDRRTGPDEFDIAITWYSYRIAITAASLSTFTIGTIECVQRLMGT